jgi:peptidoglycan hydrolase-like protein with peptidoglycan-binding domain
MARMPKKAKRPVLWRTAAGALAANPTATFGGVVMTAMAGAILTNALAMQPGRHPAPLFLGTRPYTEGEQSVRQVSKDPADALDELVAHSATTPDAFDRSLVADIQTELTARGLYSGVIDGLAGPMTVSAIIAFQHDKDLAVTGQPTADVLAALRRGDERPQTALDPRQTVPPLPPRAPHRPNPVLAAEPSSEADPIAAILAGPEPVELPPLPVRLTREDAPVPELAVQRRAPEPLPIEPDPRLSKIQQSLDLLGYGPLKADGYWTPETRQSIRRFEENRGLPVTGEISERFLAELIMIGGLSLN